MDVFIVREQSHNVSQPLPRRFTKFRFTSEPVRIGTPLMFAILRFAFRREYATIAVPLRHSTFADALLALLRRFSLTMRSAAIMLALGLAPSFSILLLASVLFAPGAPAQTSIPLNLMPHLPTLNPQPAR